MFTFVATPSTFASASPKSTCAFPVGWASGTNTSRWWRILLLGAEWSTLELSFSNQEFLRGLDAFDRKRRCPLISPP